ncbi:MAG: ISAzo13 family transposase [Draconibacterium sp.]|nr:ISAzo13 family transposase [Draconibacterium sp.]
MGTLQNKLNKIIPILDEKQRRLYLTSEAEAIGRGGKSLISKLGKISRPTLNKGEKELNSQEDCSIATRIRKEGGGRKKITESNTEILKALELLVEPVTRGDPESSLRWTIKSVRTLSGELNKQGHKIGKSAVGNLLAELGYSLQSNKKKIEGNQHPDRNSQFEYINKQCDLFIGKGNPVISVGTKKKELIGNYKNNGKEYRPKKNAREVEMHDFGKQKAAPYGVYDIDKNNAFVNVGKSCDTGQFAVASIREWWVNMGAVTYPKTRKILINADGGGSNGYRLRLWKIELQKFANEFKLEISVCHFPPGTSKWNKIEHRLFSQISLNWRGVPLVDYETVVQLIGSVKTSKGLSVMSKPDENIYEKGMKISNEKMNEINILRRKFHGEWNYVIKPN